MRVGDTLKDNDPRMPHRTLKIMGMNESHVMANDGWRTFQILRRRIYADGKPRRNGFDLVRNER